MESDIQERDTRHVGRMQCVWKHEKQRVKTQIIQKTKALCLGIFLFSAAGARWNEGKQVLIQQDLAYIDTRIQEQRMLLGQSMMAMKAEGLDPADCVECDNYVDEIKKREDLRDRFLTASSYGLSLSSLLDTSRQQK